MTVVKRQAQSPAGVSSEVEVLKALKSLFEHHKALDEKVREKLRLAMERVSQLEEELNKSSDELTTLRAKSGTTEPTVIANGHIKSSEDKRTSRSSSTEDGDVTSDFKSLLEKQSTDLLQSRSRISELTNRVKDLEDSLKYAENIHHDLNEENRRLRDNLRENNAQKEDQEERISTLEQRYLNAQRESTALHDLTEKLNREMVSKDGDIKLLQEKINGLTDKLQLSEQRLSQVESEKRQEALIRDQELVSKSPEESERQLSLEDRILRLESQLDEKAAELARARQREKMNDEHNQRLSATVDKLLAESNERLQSHLKERMSSLEEKNLLAQDLEKMRKLLEEAQHEKEKIHSDLNKAKAEVDGLRSEVHSLKSESMHSVVAHVHPARRAVPMKCAPSRTDWLRLDQSLERSSFDQSESEFSHADDGESVIDSVIMSPTGHTDAQALALMLQEQLDAINNEILLIQEEKQSTEQRAEELESQVGSMESSMSLMARSRNFDIHPLTGVSPTPSGRSTPSISRISPSTSEYMSQLYSTSASNAYAHMMSAMDSDEMRHRREDQSPRPMRQTPIRQRPGYMESGAYSNPGLRDVVYGNSVPPDVLPRPMTMSSSIEDYDQHRGFASTPSMDSLDRRMVPGSGPGSHLHYPVYLTQSPLPKKKSLVSRLFTSKRDKLKQQQLQQHQLYSNNFVVESDYVSLPELSAMSMSPTMMSSSTISSQQGLGAGLVGQKGDYDRRRNKKHELLAEAMKAGTPFALWNGPTIVAWLELWVGMPAWYVAACRANVKSGGIMSSLSDAEIQREIGISSPLHRLKLRLAIQEMVALTSPSAPKPNQTSLAYGSMNHEWIGNEWYVLSPDVLSDPRSCHRLPSLGLSQYRSTFMECLVDARMLDHLTKKDLRLHLKMLDAFHRTSLQFGIACLKRLNYDKDLLDERRRNSENENTGQSMDNFSHHLNTLFADVLVWSNDRVMKWCDSIGLKEYSYNLTESGVHGALVALDDAFDSSQMALALQIPTQNLQVSPCLSLDERVPVFSFTRQARQVLDREFHELLQKGTDRRFDEV